MKKSKGWTKELARLNEYFISVTLPEGRFEMNKFTTTNDLAFTLDSLMNICEANLNNPYFECYLLAMQEIEKKLKCKKYGS